MPSRQVVEIDETAFPLIIVEMSAVLDGPAMESMFRAFDRVLSRNARFAAVIDTTPLTRFPDALERKRIAEWMTKRIAAEALYNLGNGLVIDSVPARAAITAINWLRRPVNPQAVFSSRWEAVDWCCERLLDAGIDLSPAILARRGAEHAKGGHVPAPLEARRPPSPFRP
jgi:hypothetical protein